MAGRSSSPNRPKIGRSATSPGRERSTVGPTRIESIRASKVDTFSDPSPRTCSLTGSSETWRLAASAAAALRISAGDPESSTASTTDPFTSTSSRMIPRLTRSNGTAWEGPTTPPLFESVVPRR